MNNVSAHAQLMIERLAKARPPFSVQPSEKNARKRRPVAQDRKMSFAEIAEISGGDELELQ